MEGLVRGLIFKNRSKKLQTLISGENAMAGWPLGDGQKTAYVYYLFQHERGKT